MTKGQGQECHGTDATKDTGNCLDGAFPAPQFSCSGKDSAQALAMVSLLPECQGGQRALGALPAHPGLTWAWTALRNEPPAPSGAIQGHKTPRI